MNARTRFEELQRKSQTATRAVDDYRITLIVKYGSNGWRSYASRTEQKRFDILQRTADRAFDRFFTFLQSIAPRDFARGFGCAWIRDSLTFDDAITHDRLSVVPPPSYGLLPSDMVRLAGPVRDADDE